jgi:glyoxylase-like metal-dependent hydrolase (beta-lactamase superfamily II)
MSAGRESGDELRFDRQFDAPYGKCVEVGPLIRRMLARNAGPFTFKGTSVAIVGRNKVAVIDPGPDDPAHLQSLRRALAGISVSHILVTHTHRDHSPAARHLRQWTGAPVYAFGPHAEEGDATLEEGADRNFAPDFRLSDGDVVEGDGFTLEAVHTPGHTSNHLCYALKQDDVLFSGDHVMGWSTTVVAPPDGDMAAYMRSLEKLLRRDERIYWPTHGGAIGDPKAFVSALLQHRRAREGEVMAAIRPGSRRIPEIVGRIYPGLDARLLRAASLTVLAHLNKLVQEGRVTQDGDGAEATYIAAGR